MNNMFVKLVGLLSFLSIFTLVVSIVCTQQVCDRACNNEPTLEKCNELNQEYRPNSSFCQCCATCVDYIPVGATCGVKLVMLPFIGSPPPIEKHCEPGSICVENICVEKP